jgi:hypothetical protein
MRVSRWLWASRYQTEFLLPMEDVRFARTPQNHNGSGLVLLAAKIESLLSGVEAPVKGCIPVTLGLRRQSRLH